MILYRVEHRDGRGPWASGLVYIHRAIAHAELEKDASLYAEARSPEFMLNQRGTCWGDHITEHHIFGCETLDDLRLWYPSPAGCAAMADAGAKLMTYSVSELHTIEGGWEVAFDRRFATLLEASALGLVDLHSDRPTSGNILLPETIPLSG